MATGLRIDLAVPSHGWVSVRLAVPAADLQFAASYIPRDSVTDLARATYCIVAGVPDVAVIWNTEPTEFEFHFATTGRQTRLEVFDFQDSRRRARSGNTPLMAFEADSHSVAVALWRGLRRLQGSITVENYRESWGGYPFPVDVMDQLAVRLSGQSG